MQISLPHLTDVGMDEVVSHEELTGEIHRTDPGVDLLALADLRALLRVAEPPYEVEYPHPVRILDVAHGLRDSQPDPRSPMSLDVLLNLLEHRHVRHAGHRESVWIGDQVYAV